MTTVWIKGHFDRPLTRAESNTFQKWLENFGPCTEAFVDVCNFHVGWIEGRDWIRLEEHLTEGRGLPEGASCALWYDFDGADSDDTPVAQRYAGPRAAHMELGDVEAAIKELEARKSELEMLIEEKVNAA